MADLNAWSIIVPGVVTPCVVAGFAFVQQRFSSRSEGAKELREVLDDAVEALTEFERASESFVDAWRAQGTPIVKDQDRFNDATHLVRYQAQRLSIRIGRDQRVSRSYRAAGEAGNGYFDFLWDNVWTPCPWDEASSDEARKVISDARIAFTEEAHLLAGLLADLKPSPLWSSLPLPAGRDS